VLKHKVGLILLDYLQLMGGNRKPGENREQEVAGISRELKQLAKELNVPVIALSQLSRQGDNAEPRLSHLRESGAIEQDADDVFFLYPVPDEDQQADMSLKDSLLLIIAKHRNGMLDKLPLKFVKNIQRLMTEQEYERYMTGRNMPGPAGSSRLPYPDEKDLPF
jgi:replicative DNA helicase